MSKNYAVVMAGGQGTRFWPESVSAKPKQYLSLAGDESLLTQSLKRFGNVIPADQRFIVTVSAQQQLALEHSTGEVATKGIILEPAGRNTAPCILLSLAALLEQGASSEDVVAIVPADHVILNTSAFQQTIADSCALAAEKDAIITIGIPPHFPHTGYGYIQKDGLLQGDFFQVKSFKEKPDFVTAQEYVASGNYLWNAGMFVVRIGFLLDEFAKYAPSMFEKFAAIRENLNRVDLLKDIYISLEKESIDYAIMEKSQAVLVTPAIFDWNDLGSWDALESIMQKQQNNYIVQAEYSYMQNAKDNIVFTPGKFVSLINVNELIVVANDQSVMVLPKKDAQKVKEIVGHLQEQPWGEQFL